MSEINIFSEAINFRDYSITSRLIRTNAEIFIAAAEITSMNINIILTNDTYIQAINRSFRHKNKATDVLSFPPDVEDMPGMDISETPGEIYISLERAVEQAEKYKVDFKDEVNRLLAHGILHLAGYDHEVSPSEESRMSAKEESLLALVNKKG